MQLIFIHILKYLFTILYLAGGVQGEGGQLIEIGGVFDHVHLLVTLRPQYPISKLVQKVKISSSKWVSQNVSNRRHYSWQEGYGAFSVSTSHKDQVIKYIQNQEEHHRTCSFQEEFLNFLRKHEIQFDEKYLWK